MLIRSNPSLHYPITVDKLLVKLDSSVDRFAPLFSYTYTSTVTEGDKYGDEKLVEKTFPAEFQSEIDGTLAAWKIKPGDILTRSGYAYIYTYMLDFETLTFIRIALVDIEEPCKHEIQFGGLCTNCGRDMTEYVDSSSKRAKSR
jgi:RNA polymerase II subunit A-like phosphatase